MKTEHEAALRERVQYRIDVLHPHNMTAIEPSQFSAGEDDALDKAQRSADSMHDCLVVVAKRKWIDLADRYGSWQVLRTVRPGEGLQQHVE